MEKDKIKKNQISEEKIVAIVFIAMIFSSLIFSIIKGYPKMKEQFLTILKQEEKTKYEKIVEITKKSETIFNENIDAKNSYIDIYGLTQKVLNRKYVEDSNDKTRDIVKTKEGMLTFIQKKEDMETRAEHIATFKNEIQEAGIPFLYLQAPYKVKSEEDLPKGIVDYANENADVLVNGLSEKGVNTIDLRKYFEDMPIQEKYFITDHHWKIATAWKATNYITEILNQQYDFKINHFYMDVNNYKQINQENKYLGSIGKRIGKYYAGLDDFEYIVPNFETDLMINKGDGEKRGTFEETILVENLLEENAIRENKYAAYFGGDYPEIILKNETEVANKKILVIQDSYGLPFSSFLALRVKELRTIDLRHFEKNEIEYVKQYNPDIVLMMYNPSSFYIEKNFNFE